MARLKCAECGASVGRSDVVCRRCGRSLLEDGSVIEVPASENPAPETTLTSARPAESSAAPPSCAQPGVALPGGAAPDPAERAVPADRCPHCGAEVPDPRNLFCIECMAELKPAAPAAGPPSGAAAAPSRPGGANPYATTYERNGPRLQLSFRFGVVELEVGQEVMLGRDASDQRLAALNDMNNVSRRHATIGLSNRGAWVRDEHSTNGTYVNDRPVAAGEMVDLAEGAELRLASNIRADVRLYRPGEARNG
jgi:FHA domain